MTTVLRSAVPVAKTFASLGRSVSRICDYGSAKQHAGSRFRLLWAAIVFGVFISHATWVSAESSLKVATSPPEQATDEVKFDRSLDPRDSRVEILVGENQAVCRAYEGHLNYAYLNYSYWVSSRPGVDEAMRDERWRDVFVVPPWQYLRDVPGEPFAMWENVWRLMGDFYWQHDVNMAQFARLGVKQPYEWEPTEANIAQARKSYDIDRERSVLIERLQRAIVDVNNDGKDDYVWQHVGYPDGGSLIVTNETGDAIDEKLTMLLRRHRGREELGPGYFLKVLPEERNSLYLYERQWGIVIGSDAYHSARYHVFGFEAETYFGLHWIKDPRTRVVAGDQVDKIMVFKARTDTTQTVCELRWINRR